MGVYTVANIVKKENDKVVLVEGQEIPVCDPLHALTKLIFLDEYKNSLFDISETEVEKMQINLFIRLSTQEFMTQRTRGLVK